MGPYPLEILDNVVSEDFVDQRCLELLRERLKRQNLLDLLSEPSSGAIG